MILKLVVLVSNFFILVLVLQLGFDSSQFFSKFFYCYILASLYVYIVYITERKASSYCHFESMACLEIYLRKMDLILFTTTAQKIKFSIMDFFTNCYQIRRSYLLKKSLVQKFIFCAVNDVNSSNSSNFDNCFWLNHSH